MAENGDPVGPDQLRADMQGGRDWVALITAIGLATAVNLIVIGVLIAAWYRGNRSGDYSISTNATQLLTAAFGGMIGIVGSYVGGRAATRAVGEERKSTVARERMLLDAQPSADSPQKVEIVEPVEVIDADETSP